MTIKLYYFDGYGRAEAIRMLLTKAKVPFEDVRIASKDWTTKKAELPLEFGQVPAIDIDGQVYTQTGAILRLLGKQHGYYSEDAFEAWRIDSGIAGFADLAKEYYDFLFDTNEETKKIACEKFFATTYPNWAAVFEKRLLANTSQHHLVGDKWTIVDFASASAAYSSFFNEANPYHDKMLEIVKQYPTLHKYLLHLGDDIKEYLSTRPSSPW
jgi:glutathione S-transferase